MTRHILARAGLALLLLVAAEALAEFEPYNSNKGYCGPGGWSVPEFISLFNEPCYGHDKCYNQCANTKTSKATCDNEFRLAMKIKCDAARSLHYDDCMNLARPLQGACKKANQEMAARCHSAKEAHYQAVKNGADLFHSYNCTAADLAPHQPSLEFRVDNKTGPISIATGGHVTLSWSPRYIAYCTASGGWTGDKNAAGGSTQIGPITRTSTYTLTCGNSAGASVSKSVRVNVAGSGGSATAGSGSGQEMARVPTLTLTINDGHETAMVPMGGTATLKWTARYIAFCTASGDWSGSKRAGGGSETIGPIESEKSYTLTCSNTAGASDSKTVRAQVFTPTSGGGGGPAGGSGLGPPARRHK